MARMTSTAESELGGLMQVIIAPDLAHWNRGPTYLRAECWGRFSFRSRQAGSGMKEAAN